MQIFTANNDKEAFEVYYKTHTNIETCQHFCITKRQLKDIKTYWNIADKTNINDFLRHNDKQSFESFYRTHSNEEVFEHYNINHNDLNGIRTKWQIATKTKEEQKAINKRLYGVDFTGQREDVIKNINKAKNINICNYKDIILKYTKDELTAYFNTHSTKEILEYFNTNYDNIKKVRKLLQISGKNQKEKEAVNLRTKGKKNVFQLDGTKEKSKQTLLDRYGVINIGQTLEQKQKAYNTKKQNNSFSTSSPEERYYKYLVVKYGEADVIRQYKDIRYPYACDFYIKSQDLFIELNLTWTHGKHAYNKDNLTDQLKVANWQEKAKTSEYYRGALFTWTIRDPEKLACAIKNKLNYKIYYTEDELYQ